MASKTQAIQTLFERFDVPAYPSGNVPENVPLPYLTYTKAVGSQYISRVHYYDYTESELDPDLKIEEICEYFRNGGVHIPYDGGVIWAYLDDNAYDWYAPEDEGDRYRKHRIADVVLDFEGD